ncbi:BnaAnng06650D [Brassica napus]|uniref:BnaAnng06650D protein n=1 Tax=Brassica napus TaxID=3708 RepID=A0A078HWJ5_BRANA|nr:BnaAnng06650D [Brassica napus]
MTDAGNFRLLSKDSSKDLWSSFDNPTDTLLPLRIQAYGIVYKGVLKVVSDSQVTVAVKKLDRVVQEGEKEFRNEVKAIGQTYHKNLARLIDFCNEGQSRLIVYEYLPHGMLASRAHPRPKDRRRIAVEISRGILKQLILRITCYVILINWAYDCFRNRRLGDLMEDDLGIWCIQLQEEPCPFSKKKLQEEPGMRPNMRTVTQMLEGVAQVHDPPNPSPYSIFSCEEYLPCGQVSRD